MEIHLRTLVYQNQVEIENVPVLACPACERSEVLEEVKPELKELLQGLGDDKFREKRQIAFHEFSRLTRELLQTARAEAAAGAVEPADSLDALLDLYLLARSLGDSAWIQEIRGQLRTLSEKQKG